MVRVWSNISKFGKLFKIYHCSMLVKSWSYVTFLCWGCSRVSYMFTCIIIVKYICFFIQFQRIGAL